MAIVVDDLEEALSRWMAMQTAIASLVGEADRYRIYKLVVPRGSAMPSYVMQRTGGQFGQMQCATDGTVRTTIQLDSYGKSWAEAARAAKTVKQIVRGLIFPATMGSVRVKSATLENEFDLDDPEPGLYRRSQSWVFWYFEP